jgi:pimeloyl-ACP methyl ester carboxylesterase
MPRRHAELSAELYPFEAHYLDRDGLRYHYVDEGPRETKRAIVMLHGNPSWSFYYRELIRALSPQRRAIAPDHIGCGRSDKPDDRRYHYTLASRVDDLNRLVEHLGLEQITLVVHDWGRHDRDGLGHTASPAGRTAGRNEYSRLSPTAHQELSAGARPCATAARRCRTGAWFQRLFARCDTLLRHPPRPVARGRARLPRALRQLAGSDRRAPLRPRHPAPPERYGLPRADRDRRAPPAAARQTDAALLGLRDFVFDQHFLAEWERRFPQAQVQRFDDAGHYVLEDATAEIVSAVEQFIRD